MARTSRLSRPPIPKTTPKEKPSVKAAPAGRRLTREEFSYPEALGLTLPTLVLAIPAPDWAFKEESDYRGYRFKPGRVWHKLAHQTAGNACHQHYLHATPLTPLSADTQLRLNALSKQWLDTNAGVFGVTLDELIRYRADLTRLFGVDCNISYGDFEEGLYPIDTEHVGKVAADSLPKDLDDLLEFDNGWQRACGCINRWRLYCLGENSD